MSIAGDITNPVNFQLEEQMNKVTTSQSNLDYLLIAAKFKKSQPV